MKIKFSISIYGTLSSVTIEMEKYGIEEYRKSGVKVMVL